MPNAVIILGAGSSADFGVPILSRIFSDAQARQYVISNPGFYEMLRETIWEPRGLTLDTAYLGPTIEDILTMLRDWESANERDSQNIDPPPDLENFRRHIYVSIQRAVFQNKSTSPGYLNTLINRCRKDFENVTWATFNWDCIFESSFYYSSAPPMGIRQNPTVAVKLDNWWQGDAKHLFLKLHGGINWWLVDGKLKYFSWGGHEIQEMWDQYSEHPLPNAEPVILEPSFYKYLHSPAFEALRGQWNVFFHRLIDADYVIVIGYSLPDLDTYARENVLVAFQLNAKCRWLIVDPNRQTLDKYTRLLGSTRITTREETLTSFSNDLCTNLEMAFPGFKCSS
jgi:hypothetical protein